MKPRSVKNKINQMLRWYGSKRAVADKLGIDTSYIYKFLNGHVPGLHLYLAIKSEKKP